MNAIKESKDTIFSIGTAASMLGIRADTLRYYEKKQLITSKRMDNGYRYYTKEDLLRLLCILYYRKMDISINNMSIILEHSSTSAYIGELIDEKIAAEEEEIFRHRQNIIRLNMAKIQHERTELLQQGFSVQKFPGAWIIDEKNSSWEITLSWFQNSQEFPGLDMAYLYDEYCLGDSEQTGQYQRSLLLMYPETAAAVPADFDLESCPRMPEMDCIAYSITGDSNTCIHKYLLQMRAWAREHNYLAAENHFSTRLFSGSISNDSNCEIEIYLPVVKQ